MGLMFPLFTQQMFASMTYKWGLTLMALLCVLMAPTPWVSKLPTRRLVLTAFTLFFTQVLFFCGSKIRSHSKVSRKILEAEQQKWDGDTTVASSPTEEQSMQV